MALEIYINDEKLELDPKATIAITKQVADIKQLTVIKAELTNTVTVPYTDTNKRILENAQLIYSTSALPYTRIPCRVLQDTIELIGKGYAVIDETAEAYKLTVYSGNLDWAVDIYGKTLRDIDYTDKVHLFTQAAVIATHTAPNGVYVYPPIKWAAGFGGFTAPNKFRYFRPFVYIKDIFKRIFAAINYAVVGDLNNDPLFSSVILECNRQNWADEWLKFWSELTAPKLIQRGFYQPPGQINYSRKGYLRFDGNEYDPLQPWGINMVYLAGTGAQAYEDFTTFDMPQAGKYTFRMTLTLDIQSAVINGVTVNQPPVKVICQGGTIQFIGINTNEFYHLQQKTVEFTFETTSPSGSAFSLFFIAIGQTTAVHDFLTLTMLPGCRIELIKYEGSKYFEVDASQLQPVNLAWQLPEIEQLEFVKTIAFMFGRAIIPDIVNKTVEFVKWDDLQTNKAFAIDWSEKYDTNKKPLVKYRLDGWAQKNYFTYTPDEEGFVTTGFGDAELTINDQWLPLENTFVELPFSATELIAEGFPLIIRQSAPFTWDLERTPRILATHTDNSGIEIDGNVVQNFINSYFIKTGQLSLGWSNRLLPDYFNTVQAFIDNPKIVEAEFLLSPLDIQNFKPFTPIYVDKFNAYFYVNKITNWVKGKPCKVELIRL